MVAVTISPTHTTVRAVEGDTPTNMSLSLQGGRRVTLKQADITKEKVDAIVNAVSDALSHIGGAALAISRASNAWSSTAAVYGYNQTTWLHSSWPSSTHWSWRNSQV